MIWHKNSKKPTFEEKCRMEDCKFLGCICCWFIDRPWVFAEYNHIVEGNRRKGHMYGYALCRFHHRNEPLDGMTKKQTAELLGPSLGAGSKPFHARWGSNQELLEAQNQMLEAYRNSDRYQGSWRKR